MKKPECPECGNRTYNEVCDICGERIPNVADMTQQPQTETGRKWSTLWNQDVARKWSYKKTEVSWIVSIVLFVLVCLGVIAIAVCGPESISRYFRYDKAGTGTAAHLPQIEAQEIYNADGVAVTVNSVGLLDGKLTLVMTVVNTSAKRQNVDIEAVAVDNRTVSSFELKSDYAENVGRIPRMRKTWRPPQRHLDVGMWGVKRGYLVLDLEELSDLAIDTVGEIALDMSVYCSNSDQTRVVVSVKTDACE